MILSELDKILADVEKPARYIGNEINAIIKPPDTVDLSVALVFPDVYEIGCSYLGFQILYDLLNNLQGVQAERAFAPWPDMEDQLRQARLPLYGLETKRSLTEMEIIGFTLQHELSYTNILNLLDLAMLPLFSRERQGLQLVIAGGPGAFNPEPLWEFIDVFVLGEGEEVIVDLIHQFRCARNLGWSRTALLEALAGVQGLYVPALYKSQYNQDASFQLTKAVSPGAQLPVQKRFVRGFAGLGLPQNLIVPLVKPVHDRVSVEICRGCARGCRFCQAGMIYRPVRERNPQLLLADAGELLKKTGSYELSLSSLSSADYSSIEDLVLGFSGDGQTSVSLPSLRVDSFSVKLAELTKTVRKTGLTLAPEAGSQRLRDVINKNVQEEDIFAAARAAFVSGWTTIKLYFMLGLPTETRDDISGIVDLVKRLQAVYKDCSGKKGKLQINLGVSTFVPKAHTPFQWFALLDRKEVIFRQGLLKDGLKSANVKIQTTGWQESRLETALAKGDRRLSQALYGAWKRGCRFDAWREHFRPDLWDEAFVEAGIDLDRLVNCPQAFEQPLPWDHIDSGVSRKFLVGEARRALAQQLTPDCTLDKCQGCGICSGHAVKPWRRGAAQCD